MAMNWEEYSLALSCASCCVCEGTGMVDAGQAGVGVVRPYQLPYSSVVRYKGARIARREPCLCALRSVFRSCYARYRRCALGWGEAGCERQREEYAADFYLLTRRTLAARPQDWDLARWHLFSGASMACVAVRLGLCERTAYGRLGAIKERLGRVFAETEPYALYPLDAYFGGAVRVLDRAALPVIELTERQQRGVLRDRAVLDVPRRAA